MNKLIERFLFTITLLISIFFCFYRLGNDELERWDEQTNVTVVNSSLHSNTPWILQLQSKPFFEKPPLWYYLTMGMVKVGGENNFAYRFVSAISGLTIILLTYRIGQKLFSPLAGILSSTILLSTPHLFLVNPGQIFSTHNFRSADLDSLFIFFILSSFYFLRQENLTTKNVLIGTLLASLGFLTKGPLSLLVLTIILCFQMINHKVKLHQLFGVLGVCILVIVPWYWFMISHFGSDFLSQHFGYHIFGRGLTPLEGHLAPWYFYLQLLFNHQIFLYGEIFVFSLFIFLMKKNLRQQKHLQIILILICTLLLILTITQTKLAWYLLPLYPFLALFIGGMIDSTINLKSVINCSDRSRPVTTT